MEAENEHYPGCCHLPEGAERPTFVSPVGEPVHHVWFLISVGQTQSFAAYARHVVDISAEHVRLERAEDTRRVAGFSSGCSPSDISQQGINHQPAHLHGREPIHANFKQTCCREAPARH